MGSLRMTLVGPIDGGGVDGAVHIWSDPSVGYPWSPHDAVELPAAGATAEELFHTLDGAGFGAAVCVQPRVYGYDHAYLASALRRWPERIAGVCLVNPIRASGPDELAHLVNDFGFRGLRLLPLARPDASWLDGPDGDPLWAEAARLSVPVSVLARPEQLGAVRRRAAMFASVPVVIDHLGGVSSEHGPAGIEALAACADAANVVVKVSQLGVLSAEPWPYRDLHPVLHAVLDAFGPSRLVFGTDWPYALGSGPYANTLRAIDEALQLSGSARAELLGGTARRLWWRPSDPAATTAERSLVPVEEPSPCP